ncbi:MAG: glycosyltransferase [Cyclobacteriaceae bacterium]|nr:glycosyltransferase [Cyclobacteriaceae bacterium SS2]
MKISVITVTYNSAKTLRRTLESVKAQDHPDIEHIIVDGASTDGTVDLIKKSCALTRSDDSQTSYRWISEPDKGMYDAINKGIEMATGEVIGILNSDDCYSEETILSQVADAFSDDELEAIYGDIRFVQKHKGKTQRYYSAKHFHPGKFTWGYMPPHPSFYARKATYEKLGGYQTDYTIAADYELLIRFLFTNRIKTRYLPLLMVDMLPGGLSNQSWKSRWLLNKEIVRACHENGIQTNMLKLSLKYFKKVFEYVNR